MSKVVSALSVWRRIGFHFARVNALRPFVEGYAGFSKTALPKHFGITGDITCSADGKTLELSDHCFSHTRYLFHWKRLKEGGQFIWVKDTEPIRFVQIGSYLGKKFDGASPMEQVNLRLLLSLRV